MTVLVTGAAGFIGMTVSLALMARGETVVGIDNVNDYYDVRLKEARLARLMEHDNFSFVRGDIVDAAALAQAAKGVDRIVHLAAQAGVRYSLKNPGAYIQANIVGHLNVIELRPRDGGRPPASGLCQFLIGLWRQHEAALLGG